MQVVAADWIEILAGRGYGLDPTAHQRTVDLCLASMRGDAPAGDRCELGTALGRLGDPRFREDAWFLPDEPLLGFVAVPGGEYSIGSDPDRDSSAYDDERPLHTVQLSPFWLTRWPVTVVQFQTFVKSSGFGIEDKDALTGVANHPVVLVSWDEALAYCEWLTEHLREVAPERVGASDDPTAERFWRGFASGEMRAALPTEAQWEAAARGPAARLYPWGEEAPTGEHANFGGGIGTTPVGIYPRGRGPFGTEDQAGNVREWCADVWDEAAYEKRAFSRLLVDPCHTESDDFSGHVRRGGSWLSELLRLRAASRRWFWRGNRVRGVGFRVVASPFSS